MLLFISTILLPTAHRHLYAQGPSELPPTKALDESGTPQSQTLPDTPTLQQPDLVHIQRASILPARPPATAVLESDTQSKHGSVYNLSGDVVITFNDHVLRADNVTYDEASGEVTAAGHLRLTGGENDEYIKASHGIYNLHADTGRFFDVTGSVGLGNSSANHRPGYQSPNPFLFSGREVVKTGPANYDVYDGSVTSCLLPHADWQLFSNHFAIDDRKAHGTNSVFRLLGVPILYLPYVTHPTNADDRQSGLLIPIFGYSSASQNTGSKGLTIGEQGYLTLGRSADLTVGTLYYSKRGFSENGTFRYRGPGDDFFSAHLSALQDRGFNAPTFDPNGNPIILYTNQGGQDVTTSFKEQFTANTRIAGDAEYLSSYVYREVFTENFNQAVSTDITSTVYVMNEENGYALDARFDRYQGLKVVPVPVLNQLGQEVKVFHAPSFDFSADDHHIQGTPLFWSLNASIAGLKRVQPNFQTSGIVERLDFHPEISLPLHTGGWNIVASAAARESFYSRSRQVPYAANGTNPPNATPIEVTTPVNRADAEITLDIRPPVLERTFAVPAKLQWALGSQVRHTIESNFTYRDVSGVNNFLNVLRFDNIDLVSDTNEMDYALTQHLYFRPRPKHPATPRPGCPNTPTPSTQNPEPKTQNPAPQPDIVDPVPQATNDANGIPNASATAPDQPTRTHARHADPCAPIPAAAPQEEWASWKIEQKYFFDPSFGNAVINTRRNIFDTTLSLSGVAFLTGQRDISPIISRMRVRTSGHTDFEWDFDYDTGASKINSSNVFLDVHEGKYFGGVSYALLNAPGRFNALLFNQVTNTVTGTSRSSISNFSQMRLLSGYGTPSKPGISVAAGAGLDLNAGSGLDTSGPLQYLTIQASYNWNCCGVSLEYREYDLGAIRNEGSYRFNFTLANIGTAGNLRRNESLF